MLSTFPSDALTTVAPPVALWAFPFGKGIANLEHPAKAELEHLRAQIVQLHSKGEKRCAGLPLGWHSLLAISEKARVLGKVMAEHVIISSEFHGSIQCEGLLKLQPRARIVGYGSLEMHHGASINGELRRLKSSERPTLRLAASSDK